MYRKLFGIVVSAVLIVGFLAPALPASAEISFDLVPLDASIGIDDLQPIAEGDIQIEYINRNEIKVTFAGGKKPTPSFSRTYNDIFGGLYVDSNSDDNWNYVQESEKSGSLNYLDDHEKINDQVGDPEHSNYADTANLKSLELTIAFASQDTYYPVFYLNENYQWTAIETGNNDMSPKLSSLDSVTTPRLSPKRKENFNLIGKFDPASNAIKTYETGQNVTFNYCPNNVFKQNCDSNGGPELAFAGGTTIDSIKTSTNPVAMKFSNGDGPILVSGGADQTGSESATGTTDNEAVGPSCNSGLANPLAWIICPTLGIIDGFLNWAEKLLYNYLDVDLGGPEAIGQLRQIWSVFARIATIILVIIGLVMVISTAMSFGWFDAYTVKKVLPRLVIAAIAIWVSFSVIVAYIEIMNVIGRGIGQIMLAPFGGAENLTLQSIVANATQDTGAGSETLLFTAMAAGTIVGVASIGGVFGLVALALTVLFGFVVAIVTLTLRQMLIIALLVMAPLGIAAWILPNTDKIWKLWSGTLNKLLLMFPMIVALIASGKILAEIFSVSPEENGLVGLIVPIIAYVLPFFLLPATFKAAGGAFSRITGMVNNKSKGVFDKGKNWANTKKDANKKALDESKLRQSRINLANGNASLIDRARLGQAYGIRRGTRTALRRERQRQAIQGLQEEGELEKIDSGVGYDSAYVGRAQTRSNISLYNREDALQEVAAKERATAAAAARERLRADMGAAFNDRAQLEARFNAAAAGSAERRAVAGRLVEMGADGSVSTLRGTDPALFDEMAQTKEWGDAFRDKSPDLTRAPGDSGAWDEMRAEGVTKLTARSIGEFFARQQLELASGDATRITAAENRIRDMHSALKSAAQSDALRGNMRTDQVEALNVGMHNLATAQASGAIGGSMAADVVTDPNNGFLYNPSATPPAGAGNVWLNSNTNRYEKT